MLPTCPYRLGPHHLQSMSTLPQLEIATKPSLLPKDYLPPLLRGPYLPTNQHPYLPKKPNFPRGPGPNLSPGQSYLPGTALAKSPTARRPKVLLPKKVYPYRRPSNPCTSTGLYHCPKDLLPKDRALCRPYQAVPKHQAAPKHRAPCRPYQAAPIPMPMAHHPIRPCSIESEWLDEGAYKSEGRLQIGDLTARRFHE